MKLLDIMNIIVRLFACIPYLMLPYAIKELTNDERNLHQSARRDR